MSVQPVSLMLKIGETNAQGVKQSLMLPRSTSHPDGTSTLMMGLSVFLNSSSTAMNGSRGGGLNEKPVRGRCNTCQLVRESSGWACKGDAPKTASIMMSACARDRRNSFSCAPGAMGIVDAVDGGGAIKGKSMFSHCFLSFCTQTDSALVC